MKQAKGRCVTQAVSSARQSFLHFLFVGATQSLLYIRGLLFTLHCNYMFGLFLLQVLLVPLWCAPSPLSPRKSNPYMEYTKNPHDQHRTPTATLIFIALFHTHTYGSSLLPPSHRSQATPYKSTPPSSSSSAHHERSRTSHEARQGVARGLGR